MTYSKERRGYLANGKAIIKQIAVYSNNDLSSDLT